MENYRKKLKNSINKKPSNSIGTKKKNCKIIDKL